MEPNYTKKYYALERNHWWFIVRESIIKQQLQYSLPKSTTLTILNAGAGTGRSSQLLQQYGTVISLEKDDYAYTFLKEDLKINVVQGSVEALPFANHSFDVVCLFDVIEHVQQEDLALNELYRVCKPGGLLYCTVPAFSFLWSQHDEVNHHVRRYTKKRIRALLSKQFLIEYNTYFNFFLFFPIALYRLKNKYFSQKVASDFEKSKLLNGAIFSFLFKKIFGLEKFLLRYCTLPIGISLLCRARK